jgi:Na+-transporting methylmalonyl-CoA/oxaloacetate decarboxylase gamma subunit
MYAGIGCLLFIFLFLIIFVLGTLGSVVQMFFNLFRRPNTWQQRPGSQQQTQQQNRTEQPRQQEKIFKKDEGEYVDFEEV